MPLAHEDLLARHGDFPGIGRLEKIDAAQECRLAGPARPEDRDDVALIGGDRDALEHLERAE